MQAPQASSFKRGPREGIGAVIGIAGATNTGKTLSARRAARGLAALPGEDLQDPATLELIDGRVAFIDTERRRAMHYQVADGESVSPWRPGHAACFRFAHADLDPPFEPDAYKRLIVEADEAGFAVIIVDSFSHEWEGEGGLMEWHDKVQLDMLEEAKRRAMSRNDGQLPRWWNDAEQLDKLNIGAWKAPKLSHKKLVNRLLRCRAHVIICMRAEDKLRIETKKEEGQRYAKTTITPASELAPRDRWAPICEKRFPFELITSFVMTPDAPGVPIALKMHEDHRAFLRDGEQLDERWGQRLGAWARGQRAAHAQQPTSFGASPKTSAKGAAGDHPSSKPAAPPDDDFPGSKPPPDPYSDGPPENAKWFGMYWFDPREPKPIELAEPMTPAIWQQWASCLRGLTELAPTTNLAREWKRLNQDAILKLGVASQPLKSWALEFVPDDAPEQTQTDQSQSGAA